MIFLEKYFDKPLWICIEKYLDFITEIRMRVNCPLILSLNSEEKVFPNIIMKEEDIEKTFNRITNFSVYAYEKEIKQGYITLPGGHRVGILGEAIIHDEKICGMKNIRFLNFRICHTIKNFGIEIMQEVFDGQSVKNTLIVSKPGMGKTTLLRNIIKYISDVKAGTSISVIDERNEISGAYLGIPQIDLGIRTDVVCGVDKSYGILMATRVMGPEVIAVDEIGMKEDEEAINKALSYGITIIATIHGDSFSQVSNRLSKEIISRFEKILLISERGSICVL